MKATITTGVGFDASGMRIKNPDLVTSTLRAAFTSRYGGVTILSGDGSWKGDGGRVTDEPVQTWIIYGITAEQARHAAELVKAGFGQQMVLLEVTEELAIAV